MRGPIGLGGFGRMGGFTWLGGLGSWFTWPSGLGGFGGRTGLARLGGLGSWFAWLLDRCWLGRLSLLFLGLCAEKRTQGQKASNDYGTHIEYKITVFSQMQVFPDWGKTTNFTPCDTSG